MVRLAKELVLNKSNPDAAIPLARKLAAQDVLTTETQSLDQIRKVLGRAYEVILR